MEIVFISGWATNSTIWDKVQKELNFPVKHLEWIKVLKGDYILPNECILVGWSLGGQLALKLLQHSEVKGILLLASMVNITSENNRPGVRKDLYKQIIKMLSKSKKGYLNSFFKQCGANEVELNKLMQQAESFTMSELIEGLNMMFNEEVTPCRTLPASIIHATCDKIIPYGCSEYIFEKYLHRNTSFLPVSSVSHNLPLTHSEIIAKAVNELVQRVDS